MKSRLFDSQVYVNSTIPHNVPRREDDTLKPSYGLASQLNVAQGSLRVRAETEWEQKGERNWTVPVCAEWRVKQGEDISL